MWQNKTNISNWGGKPDKIGRQKKYEDIFKMELQINLANHWQQNSRSYLEAFAIQTVYTMTSFEAP